MAVTVYMNTDASAPTFNGSAGSLIGVLNACLVNGYGSKSSAGWAKSFTGTNIATYKAPAANSMYLGVDDTTTLYSRLRGFETATAAGVAAGSGTGLFPTDAQLSGGGYLYKSNDTSTTRAWVLIASGSAFYFFNSANEATNYRTMYFFGKLASYKSGDAFGSAIICGTTSTDYSNQTLGVGSMGATSVGHFLARSFTQIGSSLAFGVAYQQIRGAAFGSGGVAYPSPIEGALLLDRCYVMEPNSSIRGHLPGAWNPMHARPFSSGDTFTGTGGLAGRSFFVRELLSSYQIIIETSDTWES